MRKKNKNPFYKLLVWSSLFLLVSVLVAVFFITRGGNSVSSDNINLTIGGPIQIGGGQELSIDVGVENKNNVPLQLVDVVVTYPEGTKTSGENKTDLKKERFNIGDVKTGAFAHKIFKSSLFGEEGGVKNIGVSIEYRVPGSNAIFEKNKNFSIILSSSPVAIVTKGIKEITSGQETEFEVSITSNSEKILNNVVLKTEYPFGYSFKDANPKPSDGNDTWKIGTLKPNEVRIFKIKGSLQGQNDEERYFKFTVGNASPSDDLEIGTVLAISSQIIAIKKSFIAMDLSLDQETGKEYSVRDNQNVNASLSWRNDTNSEIVNAEFEVSLSEFSFDKKTVNVSNGGFYDSSKNVITWNKRNNNELANLKVGASGKLSFGFTIKNNQKESQQILLSVNARGQRISENSLEENINSVLSKTIKITTDLNLASKVIYFSGPFENMGPIPPKSEKETTYTIMWTVTNDTNNISNAKVVAKIPSYVTWNNLISPSGEKVTFDSVTGNVVWDLGNVSSQTGFSKPKREVAFQITLKPSENQIGTSPILMGNQTLTGMDSYSNTTVKDERNSLTTKIIEDPSFSVNDEKVQP